MKILVAADGSKHALHAVKYAAQLATNLRSRDKITLINVHDDAAFHLASHYVGKVQVEDYLRQLSETQLKSSRKVLDATGIAHDIVIEIGHVSQKIVECANTGKYDLIIMGAKGRGGLRDLLIGSVSQRVLAVARQPVLLIK